MKSMYTLFCFIFCIQLIYSQLSSTQAINSCSNLGYNQPTSAEDCKPGGENFMCCYISIPSKSKKYCSYMPHTKLESGVVDDFKEVLNDQNIEIKCNKSSFLKFKLYSLIIVILFSIF